MALPSALISLLLFCGSLWAHPLPKALLKVAILQKASSFHLSCGGDFVLTDMGTGRKSEISGGTDLEIVPVSDGITAGQDHFNGPLHADPRSRGDFLSVNGKRYRGMFLLKKTEDGRITVIDEVGLDDYLCGVLPMEVNFNWPREALKAQSVVSRTFALRNLHRHDSDGFDLCSTVHCQVYGGMDKEKKETNLAVDETRNVVLTYKGELADTVFFANCGGRTEDPANAWENASPVPYLRSVRCRYCRSEPHYSWQAKISQDGIVRSLRKNSVFVQAPIRSISIAGVGRSGRAKRMKIVHAAGETKLLSSHFRLALGSELIRSTLFSKIKKSGNGFYFQGRGWGHGVGLCQEGAKGLAEKGKSCLEILNFYYPGTKAEDFGD